MLKTTFVNKKTKTIKATAKNIKRKRYSKAAVSIVTSYERGLESKKKA